MLWKTSVLCCWCFLNITAATKAAHHQPNISRDSSGSRAVWVSHFLIFLFKKKKNLYHFQSLEDGHKEQALFKGVHCGAWWNYSISEFSTWSGYAEAPRRLQLHREDRGSQRHKRREGGGGGCGKWGGEERGWGGEQTAWYSLPPTPPLHSPPSPLFMTAKLPGIHITLCKIWLCVTHTHTHASVGLRCVEHML